MAEDEEINPYSGMDDDELDAWADAWEAVDRAAAEYVLGALAAAPIVVVPGPAVGRAVEQITAGVADRRWPFEYFVNALGSWYPRPAQEAAAWVAAAASTVSPPEDPGTDIEEQSAVMALQHADWLGMVLGLVRRGVGTELTAESAQRDIVNLEDVDGEIDDLGDHLDALDSAIVTISPLWQAIGALDDDNRLTDVGRWGLPHALMTAWTPEAGEHDPDDDPIDPDTEAAALAIVARQPMGLDELRRTLAKEQLIVDSDRLDLSLIRHPDVWFFDDESYGHFPTLAEGVVVTHRLSEEEVELGVIEAGFDLDAFALAADEGIDMVGGGVITLRHRTHGYAMPDVATSAFHGPAGWLEGFSAGDLVGLRYVAGELGVERVPDLEGFEDDEEHGEDVVAVVRAARRAAEYDAEYGDPELPGVFGGEVVLSVRRDRPDAFRRPLPPIGLVCEAAGFELHNGMLGLPGTPWWGEPEWFDDGQRAVWRLWAPTARTVLSTGEVPADVDLAGLAEGLRGPLLDLAAADVTRWPEVEPLAEAMAAAASGRALAGPLYLRSRAAEARGEGAAWLGWLEESVAADPEGEDAAGDLADLRSVAGEAREADRLYRLAGLDGQADEVAVLRPFLQPPADGPGRNRPCPCGSGKKYKLCHGRTAVHPLDARAPWLYRKACTFAQRSAHRPVLLGWGGLLAGTEPHEPGAIVKAMSDPAAHDFALFDGGLLERFSAVLGELLPADERELARSWLDSDRRLLEITEAKRMRGVVVRDLLTLEELTIADSRLSQQVQARDVLYARPLDDGSGTLRLLAAPLMLPRLMRGPLLALLRDGAPAEAIASSLAPRRPELRTTEGQELVMCTARYQMSEPDEVWAGLAELLEGTGDDSLHVLGPDDVVRGTLDREGDRLVVRANAVERLRDLQQVVAGADPGARLIDESTQPLDLGDAPAPPRSGSAPGAATADVELVEADIAEIARRHEDRWLADRIPALGGLTPREAAASDRRTDLEALLDDFEWTDRRQPSPFAMDVGRLRRELGLT